jgi:hypothetical protein
VSGILFSFVHHNHILDNSSSQHNHESVQRSKVFERFCGIGDDGASVKYNVIGVVDLKKKKPLYPVLDSEQVGLDNDYLNTKCTRSEDG